MTFWGRLQRREVLSGCAVLGLLCIVPMRIFAWDWDYGILPEIGIALLTASILGFTIHKWMSGEIQRDVFNAAIGHVLRPELREEIGWICQFDLLAIRSNLKVDIEEINDEVVKVSCSVDREIENISIHNNKTQNTISVDDWGIRGFKPNILDCQLIRRGKSNPFKEIDYTDASVISARTTQVTLRPGEKVRFLSKGVEYRRKNDLLHFAFTIPTVNPRIEVSASPSIEFRYGFSHHGEQEEEPYASRKTLQGTYLPGMHIGVRWWPKDTTSRLPANSDGE